jgi:LPS-assembly protein
MQITADEIDYDADTAWAKAHGHVRMVHYNSGDVINADHGEYNLQTEEGRFFVVQGTAPAKIMSSPGVLTTSNPFSFQATWAERIKNRYILHHGFLTDCKMPKPWWIMQAPVFDVIPGDRAMARHTVFRLLNVPVFYLPYFYHPLGKNPRQSGFLTPNVGHSSRYGWLYGLGYYWAMNRSYDMTGVVREFSARGPAFLYDFRGKPSGNTDFNFRLYDVDDQGITQKNAPPLKQGGLEFEVTGSADILGFHGRLDYNYLSSFTFRQAFSYSFATAVYNEVDSTGFLQRRFADAVTLDFAMQRNQDFVAATPINETQNEVVVQKLPSVESTSRDLELAHGPVPLWFSYGSSAGLLSREEPVGTENLSGPPENVLHTGEVGKLDVAPHVHTDLHFLGFTLEPGLTAEATDYTNSYSSNATVYGLVQPCSGYEACPPTPSTAVALANQSLFRRDLDFTIDLRSPVLERVFHPASHWHLGDAVKHTIDAELTYEYATGIDQFSHIIHFDASDLLSNTNQLIGTLTNRLYKKDKKGNVNEILTWRLSQARYFDSTFGGVAVNGQRTVTLATEEISPYAFLDAPRGYSPAVSTLTVSPSGNLSAEWRAEYDPRRNRMIVNGYAASARKGRYFANVGETSITTDPLLFPQSNQITFGGGYGSTNRKGWNIDATDLYDLLLHRNVFQFFTATYNTDCCGFGLQYRRINFGIRDENQYLFSFSLANLGTFGSLPKQNQRF